MPGGGMGFATKGSAPTGFPGCNQPTSPNLPAASVSGEQVFERLLNHAALVFSFETPAPGMPAIPGLSARASLGSGSLIHVGQRLVLTNLHVVGGRTDASVYFAAFENGVLQNRFDYYGRNRLRLAQAGVVVARDPARDLALIQLSSIPPGISPIPFAQDAVKPGQSVHSVGSYGVAIESLLLRYTTGQV